MTADETCHIVDDMQHVEARAEGAREMATVFERDIGCLAEVRSDQNVLGQSWVTSQSPSFEASCEPAQK